MSKEKHIYEIKDCIDELYGCDCAYYGVEGLAIAEHLYNAGYRKQRVCENMTANHPVDEFVCSECSLITRDNARWEIDEDADGDETQYEFAFRFCPRCGAKVKGGESDV